MSKFHKAFGNCQGPLDFPMTDIEARELEKQLETGEYSYFRKTSFDFEGFLDKEKADVSVISDASIDKDGEVIDPDTISFLKYQKNPVVAYNHNYEIPPVGKSLWQKKIKNVWKAKTRYLERPSDYPGNEVWFPDSIYHMIKAGSMRGKSIGGAVNWAEPTQEDADRLKFDLKAAKRISKSVEIWEYSVCPIGINSNTVVELVNKGLKLPDFILENEFPEAAELLKEHEVEIPVIGKFLTEQQYLSQQEQLKKQKLNELQSKVPDMIDRSLKRLMGKVC